MKNLTFCDQAELFQTPSDCQSQATLWSVAKKVDVWPKEQGKDKDGIEVGSKRAWRNTTILFRITQDLSRKLPQTPKFFGL